MCRTIHQKVKFQASPTEVYKILADAQTFSSALGTRATISKKIGGPFRAFGGATSGIIVDLKPGTRVVQAWRYKSFPEGVFSMATFNLSKTPNGGTQLALIHRGVPKELIPQMEMGWRKYYWEPMRTYLKNQK